MCVAEEHPDHEAIFRRTYDAFRLREQNVLHVFKQTRETLKTPCVSGATDTP
jgi:hypothetical protein